MQLAMSPNGRFVALRTSSGLQILDTLGPTPERHIAERTGNALAWVGDQLWWCDAAGGLRRASSSGAAPPTTLSLGEPIVAIVPATEHASALAIGTTRTWLVDAPEMTGVELDGDPDVRVLAVWGRRLVEAERTNASVRTIGRSDARRLPKLGGIACRAAFVLGGRAVAVWVRGESRDAVVLYTPMGELIHRIDTAPLVDLAFADHAHVAIATRAGELIALNLRSADQRIAIGPDLAELAVDRSGRHIAGIVANLGAEPELFRIAFAQAFGSCTTTAAESVDGPELAIAPDGVAPIMCVAPDAPDDTNTAGDATPAIAATAVAPSNVEAPASVSVTVEVEPRHADDTDDSADDELPNLLPFALAPHVAPLETPNTTDNAQPYANAGAHLAALLDVVGARTALGIAESWHSGRRSFDSEGDLPCKNEVLGLLGEDVGLAADELRHARTRLRTAASELRTRTLATLADGAVLPFYDIAREYALSSIATQILICAAAPRLRTSIGRLYGVLAGLAGRSPCVEHLLEVLVDSSDADQAIALELAPDAPLVRAGLVRFEPRADRIELVVDDVLIDRLRGLHHRVELSRASSRRRSDRALADVNVPTSVKRTLLRQLAERDPDRPARIVLRGRRGSGRHTLVAALAHSVGRDIAAIDVGKLPRGQNTAAALAIELVRANLAECVPVVSGLARSSSGDDDLPAQMRDVLRRHPGPVVVRASVDDDLPIDPERLEITLPPLTVRQRATAWRTALAERLLGSLEDHQLTMLAMKFRVGPGTIANIADAVARRFARASKSVFALVEEIARQHIAGRLERVATRVAQLADWNQVTLVDDMRDSVCELIGRLQHHCKVYEDWGFERRITTARGLTALFYGPPGTGKTMVAGLIGRELGLDVWRIDLARVMSKWIGETEKNLAEVFEAAEEGQVMLLFDEADSLFAKRSEVKSSNDRYANLEVNYLLQRLDAFEGVAILTTNLEGSIDPALKRRLSMRLYFPFPDEDLRAQLWAAHIPPALPIAGTLNFAELARRYPLSGGYIRNSALRAAFLAAQERRPLSQEHLVRAVQLEYREVGQLSTSGRLE